MNLCVLDADVIGHQGKCSICESGSSMMCIDAATGAWRICPICDRVTSMMCIDAGVLRHATLFLDRRCVTGTACSIFSSFAVISKMCIVAGALNDDHGGDDDAHDDDEDDEADDDKDDDGGEIT